MPIAQELKGGKTDAHASISRSKMDTADQTDHGVHAFTFDLKKIYDLDVHLLYYTFNTLKHLREISSFINFAGMDCCFSFHLNYYLKWKKEREKTLPPKGHLQTPSLRLIHTHTNPWHNLFLYYWNSFSVNYCCDGVSVQRYLHFWVLLSSVKQRCHHSHTRAQSNIRDWADGNTAIGVAEHRMGRG